METPNIDITPTAVIRTVQTKRMEWLLSNDAIDTDRLMLLRDLSKTAMDEAKISVENSDVKAKKELACILAKLVTESAVNPFAKEGRERAREVSLTKEDLPPVDLVDGELDVGPSSLTYADMYPGNKK